MHRLRIGDAGSPHGPANRRPEVDPFSGRRLTRKQIANVQEIVERCSHCSRNERAKTLCEHLPLEDGEERLQGRGVSDSAHDPKAGSAPSTEPKTASRSTSTGSTPRMGGPPPSCTSAYFRRRRHRLRPGLLPSPWPSPTGSATGIAGFASGTSGTASTPGSTPSSPSASATGPSLSTRPGTRPHCARGSCTSGSSGTGTPTLRQDCMTAAPGGALLLSVFVRRGCVVGRSGGPFGSGFRCRYAGSNLEKVPPTSRTVPLPRLSAADRDKRMFLAVPGGLEAGAGVDRPDCGPAVVDGIVVRSARVASRTEAGFGRIPGPIRRRDSPPAPPEPARPGFVGEIRRPGRVLARCRAPRGSPPSHARHDVWTSDIEVPAPLVGPETWVDRKMQDRRPYPLGARPEGRFRHPAFDGASCRSCKHRITSSAASSADSVVVSIRSSGWSGAS